VYQLCGGAWGCAAGAAEYYEGRGGAAVLAARLAAVLCAVPVRRLGSSSAARGDLLPRLLLKLAPAAATIYLAQSVVVSPTEAVCAFVCTCDNAAAVSADSAACDERQTQIVERMSRAWRPDTGF